MSRIHSILVFWAILLSSVIAQQGQSWLTYAEKSGFRHTPNYAETMSYCRRIAQASHWVRVTSFGTTPQGRALPLVIVSNTGAFTPSAAKKSGKAIVLIQSGIHAGEIDGKDASLMLLRDMVITKKKAALLDHSIVLFVPIFNVDGHERISRFNRINQNGPEEMGWRVTAQNLNLNRDYMKADAPEMRAMLKLFSDWLPDFLIDCHVTDGIDFQYDVTYSMEIYRNIDDSLADWTKKVYIPRMISEVESGGHLIAPYVWPREDRDLSKGLTAAAGTPRFSTGYCALQNRPSLLIETHMLKPYNVRVSATYDILTATLSLMRTESARLKALNAGADIRAARLGESGNQFVPLRLDTTGRTVPMEFKAFTSQIEFSDISASPRIIYSGKPENVTIPFYNDVRPIDSVRVPRYYFLPKEWKSVIHLLAIHGVRMYSLTSPLAVNEEKYRLTDPHWNEKPFEGRHAVRFTQRVFHEHQPYPAGTVVVPTDQRTARVIVNLLEPLGPDSFVSWGFFDAIFEQKEYAEEYVMEKVAREMIRENPSLEKEFFAKLTADSAFAKNPRARLNFFYQRSPYWDSTLDIYPVARIMQTVDLKKCAVPFSPAE